MKIIFVIDKTQMSISAIRTFCLIIKASIKEVTLNQESVVNEASAAQMNLPKVFSELYSSNMNQISQ